MAERIDRFCENLRVKLTKIDNEMQSLKAKIQLVQLGDASDQQSHHDNRDLDRCGADPRA
jgi:hypothetical protein